jgi:hypothetical protein
MLACAAWTHHMFQKLWFDRIILQLHVQYDQTYRSEHVLIHPSQRSYKTWSIRGTRWRTSRRRQPRQVPWNGKSNGHYAEFRPAVCRQANHWGWTAYLRRTWTQARPCVRSMCTRDAIVHPSFERSIIVAGVVFWLFPLSTFRNNKSSNFVCIFSHAMFVQSRFMK